MTTSYAPGQILVDKYQVEKVIGEGGMGVVVAALHMHLQRRVAIKFLLPGMLENEEVVARFLREARSAAMLESEHVAKVIDVGELPDGSPFMVMELLSGMDLATLVQERGPLSVQDAVEYVIQGCEAIAEAHRAGIVHRDLKPSNLFLATRKDGTSIVKVLDFGISKVHSKTGSMALTRDGAMMGSPTYMAPEQIKNSKNVDTRVDVWALGVVLYELLTGQPPFDGEGYHEVLSQVLLEPPPDLSTRRPDIPAELEAAVLRCLEKDPEKRFSSVTELAKTLQPFVESAGARRAFESISRWDIIAESKTMLEGKPSGAMHAGSTTDVAVTSTSSEEKTPLSRESNKGTLIGAAIVLVLALVVGASAWMMGRKEASTAGAGTEPSEPIVEETKPREPPTPQPPAASTGPSVQVVATASTSSSPVETPAPTTSSSTMASRQPSTPAPPSQKNRDKNAKRDATSDTAAPVAPTSTTAPTAPTSTTKKNPLDMNIK